MLFRLSQRTWSTIGGRVVVVKINAASRGVRRGGVVIRVLDTDNTPSIAA
jgi:hypothetical protein